MAKYQKKPLIIEAEPYKKGLEDGIEPYYYEGSLAELWRLVEPGIGPNGATCNEDGAVYVPWLNTLEGKHYISPNDYIITGIQGERYPCKPDIFEASYELVTESELV
jgi:hypothetical protein